jgi:TnpA family transposase
LPIATIWGDGTTSSSDGQFFRSAKRGDAAGDINARYGHDPGVSFYTHLSDQHGPYSIKVMSATNHEAPYVLDGLLHHGTLLKIDTHYTDTGGAPDHAPPRDRLLPGEGPRVAPAGMVRFGLIEEVRFASDSPLEQSGFELSVPPACHAPGSHKVRC